MHNYATQEEKSNQIWDRMQQPVELELHKFWFVVTPI